MFQPRFINITNSS